MRKNRPPRNRRKTARKKAQMKSRVMRKKRLSPHGRKVKNQTRPLS